MLKKVEKVDYRIVRALGVLSEKDNITTELNLISYNNYKPKLDLRKWQKKGDTKLLQRGLTLTTEEARELKKALDNYLEHVDQYLEEKEA